MDCMLPAPESRVMDEPPIMDLRLLASPLLSSSSSLSDESWLLIHRSGQLFFLIHLLFTGFCKKSQLARDTCYSCGWGGDKFACCCDHTFCGSLLCGKKCPEYFVSFDDNFWDFNFFWMITYSVAVFCVERSTLNTLFVLDGQF